MNMLQVLMRLKDGQRLFSYGNELILCNESNTGVKMQLSTGASVYAGIREFRCAEVISE